MPATAELLSTSAAARAAGVSAESIRAWVRAGRLQARQTPIGMLVDPLSLGRVIAAREADQRERTRRGGRDD
jgi:hypothetical protein